MVITGTALLGALLKSAILSAGINFAGQQIAAAQDRAHSSALQEDAQKFQEEMRETQYQDTVKDIEKAGLNPAMLMAGGGAGLSSTPSSAIGSSGSHNGQMFDLGNAGEFLNSITNARALDYKMHGKVTNNTREIYDMTKDIFRKLHAE